MYIICVYMICFYIYVNTHTHMYIYLLSISIDVPFLNLISLQPRKSKGLSRVEGRYSKREGPFFRNKELSTDVRRLNTDIQQGKECRRRETFLITKMVLQSETDVKEV